MKQFDLNIDRILENWECKHALREIIANSLDQFINILKKLDELSEKAHDDQCTGTNPRYPLIEEIKEILEKRELTKNELLTILEEKGCKIIQE